MNISGFAINITTDQADVLKTFYRDTLGLPNQAEMGDGAFKAGPGTIFIDGHSLVHGKAQEPHRVLIDIFVEDVDAEHKALVDKGVPCIRDKGEEAWGGLISTFVDPDGNYVQLLGMKPQ